MGFGLWTLLATSKSNIDRETFDLTSRMVGAAPENLTQANLDHLEQDYLNCGERNFSHLETM